MESSCSPASAEVRDPLSPRFVDGMEVMDDPLMCVRRRYKMAYIPSGFWSRLISRLIINLKRSGLEESANAGGGAPYHLLETRDCGASLNREVSGGVHSERILR